MSYYISKNENKSSNIFLKSLKKYNLIGNKHIPIEYLYNSRENRLKLLAGLIDTDGYQKDNVFEIMQKSDKLTNDIILLAQSLGMKVAHSKVNKTCVKKNGDRVTGIYNRIAISGNCLTDIPILLDRKKATKCMKDINFLITTINVEPTKNGKYVSFEIEDNDQFFGTDYTVL